MWFWKKHSADAPAGPMPGTATEMSGFGAVRKLEHQVSEAVTDLNDGPGRDLIGTLSGWTATGLRATGFVRGHAPVEMYAGLSAAVSRQLPFVLHYAETAATNRPESFCPDADALISVQDTGLYQFAASDVQEAVDFALIARRLSELSLIPGLCLQDAGPADSPAQILFPDQALINQFVGQPGDRIQCPTPAQSILFGEHRRRVPIWFDLDRPLGLGALLDRQTAYLHSIGRRIYFEQHLIRLAEDALEAFATLTGRRHGRVTGYRFEDAHFVIVTTGSIAKTLIPVVDHVRKQDRIKAGVVCLSMPSPFPGDTLTKLIQGKKAVTVLEQSRSGAGEDAPLLRDIRGAIDRAAENGLDKQAAPPYPDYARYTRPADRPALYSGMYNRYDEHPTFDELCEVYRNMTSSGAGRRHFFLGVQFHRPEFHLPKLERLQQLIERHYPDLDRLTLPSTSVPVPPPPRGMEPEAPWPVQRIPEPDGSVYDPGRFWDSVGYLYKTNQTSRRLIDPFVATGTVPALSSAFQDHSNDRDTLPRLIPERCTACGTCWSVCPEAALPGTVQPVEALVETAFKTAESHGADLLQLRRIQKHLVGQAHKLIGRPGPEPFVSLGGLLAAGFEELMTRMKPDGEQLQILTEAFEAVRNHVASFPIVKTETFFERPEAGQRGTGRLFALTIDPETCTGCNLCVAECPERALEMRDQDDEILQAARKNRAFMRELPDVSIQDLDPFVEAEHPETLVYNLLNHDSYHAVIGGDADAKDTGQKTAVRLFAGMIEARMQPEVDAVARYLDNLIQETETRIQKLVSGTLQVDNFTRLGDRLAQLKTSTLDRQTLAGLLEDSSDNKIDAVLLGRLTESLEHLKNLSKASRKGRTGNGRARMAMALATGAEWTRAYPLNPFAFPWMVQPSGHQADVATALFEGMLKHVADGFVRMRKARLLLDDTYDPDRHEAFFRQFGWHAFSPEEKAATPPLVVLTDRPDDLAALLETEYPIKLVLLHSTETETPAGIPALEALTHQHCFVLQSSISHPAHLLAGIRAGLAFTGPALFHILAPDPSASGIQPDQVIRLAAGAVACRAFPLLCWNPDVPPEQRLNLSKNPDPDRDWALVSVEDHTPHAPKTVTAFTFADWAFGLAEFKSAFRHIPRKDWSSTMMPLLDYMARTEDEREGWTPYVERRAGDTQVDRFDVSEPMVALTASRLRLWQRFKALTGIGLGEELETLIEDRVRSARTSMEQHFEAEAEAERTRHNQEFDARMHARLTAQLLTLSGFGPDEPKSSTSLRAFVQTEEETD